MNPARHCRVDVFEDKRDWTGNVQATRGRTEVKSMFSAQWKFYEQEKDRDKGFPWASNS